MIFRAGWYPLSFRVDACEGEKTVQTEKESSEKENGSPI